MTTSNLINKDAQYSSSLSLTTGMSGDFSMSCFNSGTSASSSTYLSYRSGPKWETFPTIVAGAQNSLGYFSASERTIRPFSATANSCLYCYAPTSGTGTLSSLVLGNGKFPYCSSSTAPGTVVAGEFTGTGGMVITNGANSLTLAFNQTTVEATTSQTMSQNTTYIANSASLVTLTLPSSPTIGQIIYVAGLGSGGWRVAQNSGQQIIIGSSQTTSGTGGSLSSANSTDCVILLAHSTSTWTVIGQPQSTGLVIV